MTILTALLILAAMPTQGSPFGGTTKHRPVKRMKAHQVRKADNGKSYYYRTRSGKMKNRGLLTITNR